MSNHDPLNQLSRLRMEVDPRTRSNQLDAIDAELRRRPTPTPSRGRRWMLGVVVATLLAGPVSAVASDRAVPGDLLYPLKQVLEPFVAVLDRDVAAEHRVEEVDELVRRGSEAAVIERRVAVARDTLADTASPILERELDRIVDSWSSDRRSADDAVTDGVVSTTPAPVDASPREPIDDQRTDIPPSVTPTSRGNEPVDTVAPPPERSTTTSTTGPAGEDGGPPPSDAPRARP